VIGSIVTVTLALVSLTALVITAFVAFVQGIDFDDADELTERAPATVLDVDKMPEFDDWYTVDVQFSTAGGQSVVTTFDWPTSSDLPVAGDRIEVAYDADDPEHADDAARVDGRPRFLPDGDPDSDADTGAGYAVAGVAGGLALVALLATIAWATRAPIPERKSQHPRPYRGGYPTPYPGAQPPPYPGAYPAPPGGYQPPPYPGAYPAPYAGPQPPPPGPQPPPAGAPGPYPQRHPGRFAQPSPQPPPPLPPGSPPVPGGAVPRFGRRARWVAGGTLAGVLALVAAPLVVTGFVLFVRDTDHSAASPTPDFWPGQAILMAGGLLFHLGVSVLAITAILASKVPAERRARD
jgi:hypothetical protein